MALSKMSELRDLSTEEIDNEIQKIKRELFDLRFQQATRQTVQPHEFKHKRHTIAQLMTLKHERLKTKTQS
jgi:large subunit ribosomal protein L29